MKKLNNLHSGFCEIGLHSDLLARVDVWIVSLGERFLKLLELAARERRPDATLFTLLGTNRRRIDVTRRLVMVHFVRQSGSRCST